MNPDDIRYYLDKAAHSIANLSDNDKKYWLESFIMIITNYDESKAIELISDILPI